MSSSNEINEEPTKRLFIISPIKSPGSKARKRSDQVKNYIIDPIATEKGYETNRSDMISKPGRIDNQIIERLLNDELVVADITDQNPNVFYELAVRHAVGQPVILMGQIGEEIPFDVSAQRVIFYNIHDLDVVEEAKNELARQIDTVEAEEFIVDSPIRERIPIVTSVSETATNETREILTIVRNLSEIITTQRFRATITSEREPERRLPIFRRREDELIERMMRLESELMRSRVDVSNAREMINDLTNKLQEYEDESASRQEG